MNVEQRLLKLNQGWYRNNKRSYLPITTIKYSLSEHHQSLWHHVFSSKLSNKQYLYWNVVQPEYSVRNREGDENFPLEKSFTAFLFLNKFIYTMSRYGRWLCNMHFLQTYSCSYSSLNNIDSFGLVRKWWYFEKNKKLRRKKPNKLKLERLRGHLHYGSGFWPLITWRIRPYKQIHNTYTILI